MKRCASHARTAAVVSRVTDIRVRPVRPCKSSSSSSNSDPGYLTVRGGLVPDVHGVSFGSAGFTSPPAAQK